ncbi:DUF7511 domain-containing protein [Haloplanus halobius]|uniref:DUF7511 domain-containing protein n=1 Tax=Haloplanus halobius TaxID=2934938 RepID=UPI002010BECF|nr:hypothetical protein [Haloplanus sp. XH21]
MTNTFEADTRGESDPDGRLRSVVVTYEGTPDRRTLYPPTATETERLTTWLTADADAFERLDEMR